MLSCPQVEIPVRIALDFATAVINPFIFCVVPAEQAGKQKEPIGFAQLGNLLRRPGMYVLVNLEDLVERARPKKLLRNH